MTEVELFEFNVVFADLRRVFPIRADESDARQLIASYFAAFRRFPLARVKAGAEAWIAHGKRFPRPAEWIEAMPQPTVQAAVGELSADEADVWLEAERRRWEGRPCSCPACRQAGVSRRPIRFVPEFDADDADVRGRIGDRVITRGHWAHGDELARWYAAKDAAMQAFRRWAETHAMRADGKKKKRPSFEQRIEAIFTKREPPAPTPEREPGQEG